MTPARQIAEIGEWARSSLPEEEVLPAIRDILRHLDLGAGQADRPWTEVLAEARQAKELSKVRPLVSPSVPKTRIEQARLRVKMARIEEGRPAASYDSRGRAKKMQVLLEAVRALERALEEKV